MQLLNNWTMWFIIYQTFKLCNNSITFTSYFKQYKDLYSHFSQHFSVGYDYFLDILFNSEDEKAFGRYFESICSFFLEDVTDIILIN